MPRDARETVRRWYADGWGAGDQGTFRRTDVGGLFAMPPTGNRIEIRAICLGDIVDGRVARHQQVSDMWRMARQLGVIPAARRADRQLALPD